jgi:hypothetical protein
MLSNSVVKGITCEYVPVYVYIRIVAYKYLHKYVYVYIYHVHTYVFITMISLIHVDFQSSKVRLKILNFRTNS